MFLSTLEKEFLFHFNKMTEEDKKEMIAFAKIKARKQTAKEEKAKEEKEKKEKKEKTEIRIK